MDLEESDTSGDLLRATDDDIVNVVVACTWNIEDALVAIRRCATSLLRQESDWADLIEESKLWLDLAREAHRGEDTLSLHEYMEAVWRHTSGISEGISIFAPVLNALTISLVVLHGLGITWGEESSLGLDTHTSLTELPLAIFGVLCFPLQSKLVDCFCPLVVDYDVGSGTVATEGGSNHLLSGGQTIEIILTFGFLPYSCDGSDGQVRIDD